MSLCPIGTYKAKLIDYGVVMSEKGAPQIDARFEVMHQDTIFNLRWYGHFTEKTKDHTIKTLFTVFDLWCEPSEIAGHLDRIASQGKESGLLNLDKEYSVVVEHDTDKNQKIRAKIRWVNNPGGGSAFERLAEGAAKSAFANMNLAGDVAKFQAENPGAKKKLPF